MAAQPNTKIDKEFALLEDDRTNVVMQGILRGMWDCLPRKHTLLHAPCSFLLSLPSHPSLLQTSQRNHESILFLATIPTLAFLSSNSNSLSLVPYLLMLTYFCVEFKSSGFFHKKGSKVAQGAYERQAILTADTNTSNLSSPLSYLFFAHCSCSSAQNLPQSWNAVPISPQRGL